MEKRISRDLEVLMAELKQLSEKQRKRGRHTRYGVAAGLAVVGIVSLWLCGPERPVALRGESLAIELQKELAAHQRRCDTLLLDLKDGDG